MSASSGDKTTAGMIVKLELQTSRQFPNFLAEQQASLAVTTYQAGKMIPAVRSAETTAVAMGCPRSVLQAAWAAASIIIGRSVFAGDRRPRVMARSRA